MKERIPAKRYILQECGEVFLDIPTVPREFEKHLGKRSAYLKQAKNDTDKLSTNGALQLD